MRIVQIDLLQMSIAAGILIIGIVIFRSLFVHRIPKKVMIILWGIAILRLVFPISISSLPGIGSLATKEYMQAEDYAVGSITVSAAENENEVSGLTVYTVDLSKEAEWRIILRILYLAGAGGMILGSVYLYMRDGRLFRESLPMEKREIELLTRQVGKEDLKKVDLRVSDRTATPVTYGVFQPAIVFPKGIYLKEEREVGFCISHELSHIKNHDNLRKLVVHGVLCIHWFNPLVWVMYFLFNRDIELLCDERAMRRSMADRQDYALALLSLAERRMTGFRTALGFGKNAVKERILAVMSAGKTPVSGIFAAVLTVALAMTVFLGGGLPTAAVEPIGAAEYVTTDDVHVLASYEEGAVNYTTVTLDKASLDAIGYQEGEAAWDEKAWEGEVSWYEGARNEAQEVWESDTLTETMVIMLKDLATEFGDYGLQVKLTHDDYQLYYKGNPVYFFADNQKQDGEGFEGRVFARAAGNGNGNTGVATRRDKGGVIIGLVGLSEEESEKIAMTWTD